jgi:hypothetical protein
MHCRGIGWRDRIDSNRRLWYINPGIYMIAYEQLLNNDFQLALREGDMFFQGEGAVQTTLRRIAKRLDELDIDYAIAGGMCLSRHGFTRFTQDVDILVTSEGLKQIHAALDGLGYIRPFAASKNLRDAETGVRIDFLISGQYPGEGKTGPIAFPVPSEISKVIDGIRFVDLIPFIQLKLASGQASHRGRDLDDVQDLIQATNLPPDLAEQLHPSLRDAYHRKWNDAQRAAADDQ